MKRFRNILVVCDRELHNSRALDAALQIAEDNNAAITLLQVLPPLTALQTFAKPQTPEQIEQAYRNYYLNKLQQLTKKFADQALIRCKVVVGTGFIETIRAVLRNQHDLVVKVAEPVSWIKRVFGSNDMHLLRKCPCPLWILAPDAPLELKRVVATIDLPMPGMTDGHRSDGHRSDGHRSDGHHSDGHRDEDNLNRQIVELAASVSTLQGATLDFLHAWQPYEAGTVLMWCEFPDKAQAELDQRLYQSVQIAMADFKQQVQNWLSTEVYAYLQPKFSLLRGAPVQVLAEKFNELQPDLVVMGTVGRSGIAGLLIGNTAETILEQLPCSVLAVKPAGFVCPIQLQD
jgi:nucleotide-binding universal stress UspA family protein